MAGTKSEGDQRHLGEVIISFQGALLTPISKQVPQDEAFGFKLVLGSGKTRRLKMFRPHLAKLSTELRRTLMAIPNVDQRGRVRSVLDHGSPTDKAALGPHPLMVYYGNIPDAKDLGNLSGKNDYVQLISVDVHPDLVKFDITFTDGATERFSMASCVAVVFLESCEKLLRSTRSPVAG
jgi:hypothetical protein